MAIYKRGKTYWYKFMWQGTLVRESSKQGNDKVARNMESAHRTSLAKGEVGIREPKKIPTLKEFCSDRIEPWAKSTFEKTNSEIVALVQNRDSRSHKVSAFGRCYTSMKLWANWLPILRHIVCAKECYDLNRPRP